MRKMSTFADAFLRNMLQDLKIVTIIRMCKGALRQYLNVLASQTQRLEELYTPLIL